MMAALLTGGCLCGRVRYEVTEAPSMMGHCHCSRCRRWCGAGCSSEFTVLHEWLRLTAGADSLGAYVGRTFCTVCGSSLFWGYGDTSKPFFGVAAGTLDPDVHPGVEPMAHAHVGSKSAWDHIRDDLIKLEVELGSRVYGNDDPRLDAAPLDRQPDVVTGRCFCEGIRYEVRPPFEDFQFCHCSRCRKHSGAAAMPVILARRERFRLLAGEDLWRTYYPPAPGDGRTFCSRCGSSMFGGPFDQPERPLIGINAGTFDGDPGVRPQAHIFVGSKAPWFTISDDLPQYDTFPP